MSIQTQINRLTTVRETIKTAIANKGVEVPANAKLDSCAEYISQIESKHADTVDGWHVNVTSDESNIQTDNTINFIVGG